MAKLPSTSAIRWAAIAGVGSAFASVLFFLTLTYPGSPWVWGFWIWAAVFVLILQHNPEHRYRRYAVWCLMMAASSAAVAGFRAAASVRNFAFAEIVADHSPLTTIAFLAAAGFFAWLDYRHTHESQAGPAPTESDPCPTLAPQPTQVDRIIGTDVSISSTSQLETTDDILKQISAEGARQLQAIQSLLDRLPIPPVDRSHDDYLVSVANDLKKAWATLDSGRATMLGTELHALYATHKGTCSRAIVIDVLVVLAEHEQNLIARAPVGAVDDSRFRQVLDELREVRRA